MCGKGRVGGWKVGSCWFRVRVVLGEKLNL